VLARLLHYLRDGHCSASHADIVKGGAIPLIPRRFGNQGFVATRDARLIPEVQVGDEVTAIDGRPFLEVFDHVASELSTSTPGFMEFATEFGIVVDRPGTSHTIRVRSSDGVERDVTTTTRAIEGRCCVTARPASETGQQVAPSVVYLDLNEMDDTALDKLMPTLAKSSAVIMDLRGYLKKAALKAIAHFASGPVAGPLLQVPIVHELGPHKFLDVEAVSIRAALEPHLAPKLFILVDGKAISAAESFLQIVRNGKLGILVGEPSAGTNGNVNSFSVAGGFTVEFTGMRAVMSDGRVVQGNGFQPDILIHQTPEGIRANRDEILDAAVHAATAR